MQFCEDGVYFHSVPKWAAFLLNCGFLSSWVTAGARRISIISMPCDSAAAGLVTLGAMRHRLSVTAADDSSSHFLRLENLASHSPPGPFLRHQSQKGLFVFDKRDGQGNLWAKRENSSTRIMVIPSNAKAWRIDGEPPVEALDGHELRHREYYERLIDSASPVVESNFTRSDSTICLAGRVAGETATRAMLARVRFQRGDLPIELPTLLAVHDWSPKTVSRVTFFNSRTNQLDRGTSARLVIADGDAAFLRIVDADQFRQSDVIGVIHRTIERDRLESVGRKLADMTQWYVSDTEMLDRLQHAPPGIAIVTMRHR